MLPEDLRELRRVLRYRHHVVQTSVKMQNKMAGLLMEVGAEYSKKRLRGKKYFKNLLDSVDDIPQSVKELLKMSRAGYEMFQAAQKRIVKALHTNELIRDRVERLMTIRGDPSRFNSIRQAISYCGLCSAQRESAGKEQRGPISKMRNKHLQTILIEAAKIAPHWNPQLADLREKELKKGNKNRATLAVARKLVAYMMAVDKSGIGFIVQEEQKQPENEKRIYPLLKDDLPAGPRRNGDYAC